MVATEPNEQTDDTGGVDAEPAEVAAAGTGIDAVESESPDERIRRKVGRIRWLTFLSSTLSVLLAMAATVPTTDRVLWTLLVVTSLQFAFVVPASLVLAEPKRWARTVLLIATPVSAVMWVVALTQTAWLLLPGNMLLVLAFIPLRDAEVADFFRRGDRTLADIRAGR
ncbi:MULTISPECIES: hypothetical protein [Prauserella salsuginis group]|uniref:Uncharacterized protein n=2 Tax=Prauserella salsuginis group TaxID=2893672 RepID=A0A839XJG3_9PSEU|nr:MULTISPECIES: hypothetical protein [Prauserella salsuginis group]MBB3662677.1 hypothetical protein [Prauserella sediminis]MCR3720375.1 hypothetical protein [Prauserella flava]MCR3733916.1 hypothetical protein [Prauserella salsuginis]